jgi:hypothetical protein
MTPCQWPIVVRHEARGSYDWALSPADVRLVARGAAGS